MDIQQTIRMIDWLDDQRRQDKLLIATLQERIAQQQDVADMLTRRLTALESDQTTLQVQLGSSNRNLEVIDQMRREMQQLIEGVEVKRLNAEREADKRADIMRDQQMRQVRDLADKFGKLERTTTELPAIASEKDRLSGLMSALQQRVDDLFKRVEEPERRVTQVEEQRRIDARRLTELETDLPDVRKSIDSLKPKIALIEQITLRNEQKITEVQNGDRDRREQIQQFIDQQTLLDQQRDGQMKELLKRATDQESAMQRNSERFESWAEAYRDMKKIIDDYERIGERLERRISEVVEMQRLSEERFRQEWNDHHTDEVKKWKNYTSNADDMWRQHDRDFERFTTRLAQAEESLPALHDSLQRLWQLERERALLYRERYQSLLMEYDKGLPAPPATPKGNIVPDKMTTSTQPASTPPSPLSTPPTTTSTFPAVPPPPPSPLSPLSSPPPSGSGYGYTGGNPFSSGGNNGTK